MTEYKTEFGSLKSYRKGGVEVIDDNPKNYVFSNIFEVANASKPWERVAVAKNMQYVIEIVRAEGTSPWYAVAHDEMALCMDGKFEVHLVKLDQPNKVVPPEKEGAVLLKDNPDGRRMGRVICGHGHMALLPKGAAYRFHADEPSVILIQTIQGDVTVEKWADICLH
jgi:hypothetical protein